MRISDWSSDVCSSDLLLQPENLLDPDSSAEGAGEPPQPGMQSQVVARGRRRRRRGRGLGLVFWLAVAWLVVVVLCAVLGDRLPVSDPLAPDVIDKPATPRLEHPLGTDGLGRATLRHTNRRVGITCVSQGSCRET